MITLEKKLCPFCGTLATREGITSSCSHCKLSMYYRAWNSRPIENELRELLGKREEDLKDAYELLNNMTKIGDM